MLCLSEIIKEMKLNCGTRLTCEDYDRLLKSMRLMISTNPFSIIKDVTPAELMLVYCAADYYDTYGIPVTVVEAAGNLNISVPAVSRTLKSLEAKGYIERRVDENDRRSIRILLTDSGKKMFEQNMRNCISVLDSVFAEFTDEELSCMVNLHCKFTKAMSKTIAELKGGTK